MNLQNLNLTELTEKELREIEGGVAPWLLAIATGLAWSAWENIGDIRDGWNDGAKRASRY